MTRTLIEQGGAPEDGDDWDLPTSLVAAYRRRLQELSKPARDLSRAIALMGGRPPVSIVQMASGLKDARFASAMAELERRRVTDIDTGGERDTVALHSEALRTAVLDSVRATQANNLHRRAAVAWLRAGDDMADYASHTARHFYAAGDTRAAFPHALAAAWRSSERMDFSSVRKWMDQIGDPGRSLEEVSQSANYRHHMLRFQLTFNDGDLDAASHAIGDAILAAPDVAPLTQSAFDVSESWPSKAPRASQPAAPSPRTQRWQL